MPKQSPAEDLADVLFAFTRAVPGWAGLGDYPGGVRVAAVAVSGGVDAGVRGGMRRGSGAGWRRRSGRCPSVE